MTSYMRREITTVRVEFAVEAPSAEMRYWSGLKQAIAAITEELGSGSLYDDAVRIESRAH